MEALLKEDWALDAGEMSILSYLGTWSSNPESIGLAIKQVLEDALPQQELIWGPAVHQPLLGLGTDALVFATRERSTGLLTVVIRGTNPFELGQWISQDFLVGELVPWSKVLHEQASFLERISKKFLARAGEESVSRSTALALRLHLGIKPPTGLPGSGKSLKAFLHQQVRKNRSLAFCGHSLGGNLAAVLGLWYQEQGARPPRVLSFAAPSGGNRAFAERTSTRIPELFRVVNPLDIAPLAWDHQTMRGLPTVYPGIDMGIALKIGWEVMLDLVADKDYRQPEPVKATRSCLLPGTNYLFQAILQHVLPYVALLPAERSRRALDVVVLHLARHAGIEGLADQDVEAAMAQLAQAAQMAPETQVAQTGAV